MIRENTATEALAEVLVRDDLSPEAYTLAEMAFQAQRSGNREQSASVMGVLHTCPKCPWHACSGIHVTCPECSSPVLISPILSSLEGGNLSIHAALARKAFQRAEESKTKCQACGWIGGEHKPDCNPSNHEQKSQ